MRKRIFAILAVAMLMVSSPFAVQAAVTQNHADKDTYTVKETVNDDLYATADQRLIIEGDVNGDLFAVSGRVDVKGNVKGDIYAAGGMITVEKNVGGTVYVAGGQIDLKGEVQRGVFVAGGNIDIRGDVMEDVLVMGGQINIEGVVGEDIRAAGGTITILNNVGGDVMASGGTIDLDGDVVGDVHLAGGDVNVNSKNITGDLVFYGEDKSFNVSSDTKIGGDRRVETEKKWEKTYKTDAKPFFKGGGMFVSAFGLAFQVIWAILQGIGALLLGLLVLKVSPVKAEDTLKKMNGGSEMTKSLGIGCLAIPVGAVVGFVLLLSIIGWPILGVMFGLAIIAKLLVLPLAGLYLGRWIVGSLGGDKKANFLPLFVGIFVLQLIRLIPCIGGLVELVVFFVAIGAMIRMQYEKYKEAQKVRK